MSKEATHAEMDRHRFAVIDVGSNSIRLIVAEMSRAGGYRIIDDEKVVARLAQGLTESGRLAPEAMERAADAIVRMKAIAEGYDVERLRAVATSAVREAENQDEMVELIRTRSDLELEVISGDDEARFAFQSVAGAFDLRDMNAGVVDIGGGSTEIVLAPAGVIEHTVSLPLGAVRLTERFGTHEPRDDAYRAMRKFIRQSLKAALPKPEIPPQALFGSGGTFTAIARMLMLRASPDMQKDLFTISVRGHEVQRDEVKHLLRWLRGMTSEERAAVPGLSADRADIIVAGLTIADAVMKRLGVNRLRVNDRGIRDGLLLTLISEFSDESTDSTRRPLARTETARRFAEACRFEEMHCEQVARLALRIYDQIGGASAGDATDGWLSGEARELLEAAALLHDIGYLINYAKHHKHSYHLIMHSDLPGFSSRQLRIVANVARYHRRAEPRDKHAGFAVLSAEDREIVRRLSAILRIADGLDRTHTQSVDDVRAASVGDVAVFHVQAPKEPTVNLWGARRKSGLFESAFGMKARFEWRHPDGDVKPDDEDVEVSAAEAQRL